MIGVWQIGVLNVMHRMSLREILDAHELGRRDGSVEEVLEVLLDGACFRRRVEGRRVLQRLVFGLWPQE